MAILRTMGVAFISMSPVSAMFQCTESGLIVHRVSGDGEVIVTAMINDVDPFLWVILSSEMGSSRHLASLVNTLRILRA